MNALVVTTALVSLHQKKVVKVCARLVENVKNRMTNNGKLPSLATVNCAEESGSSSNLDSFDFS